MGAWQASGLVLQSGLVTGEGASQTVSLSAVPAGGRDRNAEVTDITETRAGDVTEELKDSRHRSFTATTQSSE